MHLLKNIKRRDYTWRGKDIYFQLRCWYGSSGSRDGQACVWDVRQKSNAAIARLAFPDSDCWAVAFGSAGTIHLLGFMNHILRSEADAPESKSFFAGYDDGMVYLADLRMNGSPRWQHHLTSSQGVCSIAFHNVHCPRHVAVRVRVLTPFRRANCWRPPYRTSLLFSISRGLWTSPLCDALSLDGLLFGLQKMWMRQPGTSSSIRTTRTFL